jgi:hypothetical protein
MFSRQVVRECIEKCLERGPGFLRPPRLQEQSDEVLMCLLHLGPDFEDFSEMRHGFPDSPALALYHAEVVIGGRMGWFEFNRAAERLFALPGPPEFDKNIAQVEMVFGRGGLTLDGALDQLKGLFLLPANVVNHPEVVNRAVGIRVVLQYPVVYLPGLVEFAPLEKTPRGQRPFQDLAFRRGLSPHFALFFSFGFSGFRGHLPPFSEKIKSHRWESCANRRPDSNFGAIHLRRKIRKTGAYQHSPARGGGGGRRE